MKTKATKCFEWVAVFTWIISCTYVIIQTR